MDLSVKKLAVGAVRSAAMSALGPLAGGLFFAGGAVAGKILAESEWIKNGKWASTGAEMLVGLASDKAGDLFNSALESFRSGRDGDLETSMLAAAQKALDGLRGEAPAGFDDWFAEWHKYLASARTAEVFAGAGKVDPVALEYDDKAFRALWWSRMEPVLAGWHSTERSDFTRMGLGDSAAPPPLLSAFLRERLPEAMQAAHEEVLRDEKLQRSWIGFQQHVYRDTLNHLQAIIGQLARIERKLDEALDIRIQPSALAEIVWNIPLPMLHFQNRPELIALIDHALARGATALTALHGLGGIGKTQLARAFAQQRREGYKLGVWIEAETTESLLTSLSALAPLLGVPAEQNQQAMIARVMNELSARQPWLVIFDNAESADGLRPYIQRLSGKGHVLITSRSEHWDGLATTVSVTQWSVEESARYLVERTGQTDQASAEALARDLDGLVLALEHAAAYMLAGDGMTLAEYGRVWREKLKWIATGRAYTDSVAAALGLSLDRIAQESEAAYDLLCLFAWLAPDRIPRKELLEAGAAKLPEALRAALADHDQWTEVIDTLGRYSLPKRVRVDGVITGYVLHRVVQQVMRDRMQSDAVRAQWLAAACDLVDAAFSFDAQESRLWHVCEVLLPHARAIRERARDGARPGSLAALLNHASLYLETRGLYREARDFVELSLELAVRQLGPDHSNVAVDRSNLAVILRNLGQFAEARKQIELALESNLRQGGPDHPDVAGRRAILATILRNLGEYQEAKKQGKLALESNLRRLGPDHPAVAGNRSNLSLILRDLREYEEARKQIELALTSALQRLGQDDPTVALYRSNLALILRDLGEHQGARQQVELALKSDVRRRGPDHPNVGTQRWTLAVLLSQLGEHKAALREIDEALRIYRGSLPPGHPNIVNAEDWRKQIFRAAGA